MTGSHDDGEPNKAGEFEKKEALLNRGKEKLGGDPRVARASTDFVFKAEILTFQEVAGF